MASQKKKKTRVKTKPVNKKAIKKKKSTKTIPEQIHRPVSEYYDLETNEPYPKLIFREDSLWTRIKRFFGFIP